MSGVYMESISCANYTYKKLFVSYMTGLQALHEGKW